MRIHLMIILLLSCLILSGCTIHFKGSELELDAKPAISAGTYYELESIDLLDFWIHEKARTSDFSKICQADF